MTAGVWNIAVEQGAAFLQSFLIEGGDGNALDLTDCTAAKSSVSVCLRSVMSSMTLSTQRSW